MSEDFQSFTKNNLDDYLKALGKQCRKLAGNHHTFELILVGGAAILAGYQFRDNTQDIDAVMHSHSTMKDAVRAVGNAFNLPEGWLNCDFMFTSSYSRQLVEVSTYYRTFANVLQVRTISAEYLIAMKLKAGRAYKHDFSDVIGILKEHKSAGSPITYDKIKGAVVRLYGSWNAIVPKMQMLVKELTQTPNIDLDELFATYASREKQNKDILHEFKQQYPQVANSENVNSILSRLNRPTQEPTHQSPPKKQDCRER